MIGSLLAAVAVAAGVLSGTPFRGSIAAGESQLLTVDVPANTAAQIIVRQDAVDLKVALLAATTDEVIDASDSANGIGSDERLLAPIDNLPHSYRLKIEPVLPKAERGEFTAVMETSPADERATSIVEARRKFQKARDLHRNAKADALRQAITLYDETASIALEKGDRRLYGEALYQGALAIDLIGESPRAIEYLRRALVPFEEIALRGRTARVLDRLGDLSRKVGEVLEAEVYFRQALPVALEVHDAETEADILNNNGLLLSSTGRWEEAIEMLERAIPLAQETGSLDVEAALHHNIGQAFAHMGDFERSIESYERSLVVKRRMGSPRRIARTQNNLAGVYFGLDQKEKALATIREALELWEVSGDRQGKASSLSWLGRMQHAEGELEKASEAFAQSVAIMREIAERPGEARVLTAWAEVDVDRGAAAAATEKLNRALVLSREAADRRTEAQALSMLARAQRAEGKLEAAIGSAAQSIAVVESMRGGISRRDLRQSYLSVVRDHYNVYIDLLLEQSSAGAGAAAAFTASERSRARTLLESLAESAGEIRKGVDPALQKRERQLQTALNAKELYRAQQQQRTGNEGSAAKAAREVSRLLDELREVRSEIRRTSPAYASLQMPEPITLEEVQSGLLDADTVLLEYHLGAKSGHLFVVDKNNIAAHRVPAAEEIAKLARRYHALLSTRSAQTTQQLAQRDRELAQIARSLSDLVIRPAAEQIKGKRLLIVADGALQYVPFAALPSPIDGEPLIVSHEIAYLPSASVLQTIRRERTSRPRGAVAVFADPVFDRDDPRLVASAAPPSAPANDDLSVPRGFDFKRLRFSRKEAEAIVEAASRRDTLHAVDFAASKQKLIAEDLSRYGILHFATHGTLDTDRPELSGLVFSLYDRRGKRVDGFLRLHEIYNLDLRADLVVLSACKTALGKEVNGEGLIGLTRGFMYAGAPRVLATVWNIDDRASALLMSRFYQAMLVEKLRPAEAVRSAQLSLLRDPRWRDPHYWAAFGLQGEWR